MSRSGDPDLPGGGGAAGDRGEPVGHEPGDRGTVARRPDDDGGGIGGRPILIVGAGRAGQALAAALAHAGLAVRLHGRAAARDAAGDGGGEGGGRAAVPVARGGSIPPHSAEREAGATGTTVVRSDDPTGALPADVGQAGVVLVSVRDEQLDAVVASLADAAEDGRLGRETVVLQLSGSREPAGLDRLRLAGRPAGTFHPLLPLTASSPPSVFVDGWIGVEGDGRAMDVARMLASRLRSRWLLIPPGTRPVYHAAAVLASNFPLVLAALAARLLRDAGVEPSAADGAVRALLTTAAANVADGDLDAATVARRLTGPIARGDADTVAAHRRALAADPVTLAVYDSLSRAALDVLRAGGADLRRLGSVIARLGG